MKRSAYLISIAAIIGLLSFAGVVRAVSIFTVQQGGTGVGGASGFTVTGLVGASGINNFFTSPTTTVTCTGTNSCTAFTAIGGSPISILGTGDGSFSTTSANYWASLGLAFSTTSSNFWSSAGLGFSTTSANFWSSLGLGFSTTSSNYYTSVGLSFSTSSANAWSATGLGFSTTSVNYWKTTQWFNNYPFINNATTSSLTFGGATTTGTLYVAASTTLGTTLSGAGLAACSGSNALTWTGGVFGCSAVPQGTVTSVTASFPNTSTGGATPNIASLFSTTTNWGMGSNGLITVGNSGIPYVTASSSLNLPNTALQNSSITVNTSGGTTGGAAVSLGGTLNLASFSYPFINNATTSSLTLGGATTTGTFYVQASTTLGTTLSGVGLATCNGASSALTWNAGVFGCNTISASGGVGNWFTPTSNFGALANATNTPIWFQAGFQASSTSSIASTTFSAQGNVGIASSSPTAQLTIAQLNTSVLSTAFLIDGVQAGAGAEMALNRGTNISEEANIDFDTLGVEEWQLGMQNNSSNDFELWDGTDDPVFTIKSGTNAIGFGTTTPFGDFAINADFGDVLPGNIIFNVASSSLTATTSLFSISNVGSTTMGRFGACSGTTALTTSASGVVTCGTITSAVGNWFVPDTNFNITPLNSTSTAIWFKNGIFASSSSSIFNLTVGSSTPVNIGSVFSVTGSSSGLVAATIWNTAKAQTGSRAVVQFGNDLTGSGTAYTGSVTFTGSTFNTPPNQLSIYSNDGPVTLQSATTTSNGYINLLLGVAEMARLTLGGFGVGTSTPQWPVEIASSTKSQLTLSDTNPLSPMFSFRSINGYLYISTSSPATYATSTTWNLAINQYGGVQLNVCQPATSTSMILDWNGASAGCPQIEFRIGSAAVTITQVNATTTQWYGSTRRILIYNPGGTAGAITWVGNEWIGAAPTQTTTANQGDMYSCLVSHATSTTAYKLLCGANTGIQ